MARKQSTGGLKRAKFDPKETDARRGLVLVDVRLEGRTDIQFDRMLSMDLAENAKFPPEERLYRQKDGTLYLPCGNVLNFFYNERYTSCVKLFAGSKAQVYQTAKALISIQPSDIPFMRDGEPLVFGKFGADEVDPATGLYVHHDWSRVKKGPTAIPVKKVRPTLPRPWELSFELGVYQMEAMNAVTVGKVYSWLCEGGILIGLGTHRPMYGKFAVTQFDVKN